MIEDKIAAHTQSKAFLLAMVALSTCLLSFAGLTYTQRDRETWVAHGREVARVARELRAITAERQAGTLHFLFSRDSTTFVNEVALRAPMMAYLNCLDSLTTDNAEQQARARRIRRRVDEWERGFETPAVQHNRGTDNSPTQARYARDGEILFATLRAEVTAFLGAEELLYEARVSAETWVHRILVATLPLELITLGALLIAFRRRLAEQTMRIVAQKDAIGLPEGWQRGRGVGGSRRLRGEAFHARDDHGGRSRGATPTGIRLSKRGSIVGLRDTCVS